MSGEDRTDEDIELIRKSHQALEAEYNDPNFKPAPVQPVGRRKGDFRAPPAAPAPVQEVDDEVVMYRGKPVRRGSGATPGAGSSQGRPTQFRGAKATRTNRKPGAAKGSNTDRIKQAIAALTEMHEEGLITKAEYDAKRRQLLDRL